MGGFDYRSFKFVPFKLPLHDTWGRVVRRNSPASETLNLPHREQYRSSRPSQSLRPLVQTLVHIVTESGNPARMSSQPLLQTAPGKRIALPTRVEPKVFFANERTFLSWLNFGDKTAFWSAIAFTLVAMCTMIYALWTYHWRAKSIRQRGQAGFDDKVGPTMLAIALLVAVSVNFILRVVNYDKIGQKL